MAVAPNAKSVRVSASLPRLPSCRICGASIVDKRLPGLKARSVKPYRLAGNQVGFELRLGVGDRLIAYVAGTAVTSADPQLARRTRWERQPASGNLRPDAVDNVRLHSSGPNAC